MIIAEGDQFVGQIRGGEYVEINGSAEGTIVTRRLLIGPKGQFKGSLKVDEAEVQGQLRGEANVQRLLSIASTGDVVGRIRYGQLLVERGGHFTADARNVPPELAGDFELIVPRGGQATITPADLSATDADDAATALTYTASGVLNGHLARAGEIDIEINKFTQADINAGSIVFVHNGNGRSAGFDVIVSDDDGATAGGARPVLVRIEG
jgi:cytoskeletal protein CcmA (bactofilin family)